MGPVDELLTQRRAYLCSSLVAMSAKAGDRLVRRGAALHAVHLHARAAATVSRLATSLQALASAEEHAHRTVAVQTECGGSGPLRVLHVEEVLVPLEGHPAAEERRREHGRVEQDTVDDGRVAELAGDRGIQGVLDATDADVGSVELEERVWAEGELIRTHVAVAEVDSHCCWFVGLGECMCGMNGLVRRYFARAWLTDIGSLHGALWTETRSLDVNLCTVLHDGNYNSKRSRVSDSIWTLPGRIKL